MMLYDVYCDGCRNDRNIFCHVGVPTSMRLSFLKNDLIIRVR